MTTIHIKDSIQLVDKLVKSIAKRYVQYLTYGHGDYDDLVQEGYIGAMRAIELYDEKKGPLKPYLILNIRGKMRDLVAKEYNLTKAIAFMDQDLVEGYHALANTVDPLLVQHEVELITLEDELNHLLQHTLTDKQRQLFIDRYIDPNTPSTFSDLAPMYGVSLQRLGQIDKTTNQQVKAIIRGE